jgi:hypothetical protein
MKKRLLMTVIFLSISVVTVLAQTDVTICHGYQGNCPPQNVLQGQTISLGGIPYASNFTGADDVTVDELTVGIRPWKYNECFPRPAAARTCVICDQVFVTFNSSTVFYPPDADYSTSRHRAIHQSSFGQVFTSLTGNHSARN